MTSPLAKAFYNSPAWQATRRAAAERDGYRCRICGRYGNTGHHDPPLLVLLAMGADPYNLAYVQTLCRRCHGREDQRASTPKRRKPNRFAPWL